MCVCVQKLEFMAAVNLVPPAVLEGMVCVHVCVRRYGVYMCVLEGMVCTCVC